MDAVTSKTYGKLEETWSDNKSQEDDTWYTYVNVSYVFKKFKFKM